ncbi:HD-GYP domain-containing protein [Serpentinicella sp. ANB-PHB4]|uniref:diguanylate cyclase n=1 Tax=Serpentinicella sp. ANB-PHB4 TaxID=3074076 RepID=UPI0028600671|nr:HD-GYP domain-containing protein [Serpentinicella sp. ANB-PHB4]MDR5659246.1 HD-GYP domain-containing protein [Serpentinicella sp. ANB-PHB4]
MTKIFKGVRNKISIKKARLFLFLSSKDLLTGTHSRTYFEKFIEKLGKKSSEKIGIMICDIDGLKLINNTLGSAVGDEVLRSTAHCIKEVLQNKGLIARIEGDTFAILIKGAEGLEMKNITDCMTKKFLSQKVFNVKLNVSIGFALGNTSEKHPRVIYKEAEDNMNMAKLSAINSTRYDIVKASMKILEERDLFTSKHVSRMEEVAVKIGEKMNMLPNDMSNLKLLVKFHDIGKIGIPDQILKKPGLLTKEEYEEIKKHCEIGYRIIKSVSSLAPIAPLALSHHERWDGQGYPQGLKGEEIPLLSRLIAIVDAYDAMTNDRPYKKVLTHEEALAEIQRCSGTQFDPKLVKIFIEATVN